MKIYIKKNHYKNLTTSHKNDQQKNFATLSQVFLRSLIFFKITTQLLFLEVALPPSKPRPVK